MKVAVSLTIDEEVLKKAKKIATKEGRSLSNYVNAFLKMLVKKPAKEAQ